MASKARKRARNPDMAHRRGGDGWSSGVEKLLDRAPRFKALAKADAEPAPELSDSQKEFLDDFASRLAAGVAQGDEASAPTAASKPAGRRARPKEERR